MKRLLSKWCNVYAAERGTWLVWVSCCALAAASAAIACGWIVTDEHSVRFNPIFEREFTRLPPMPKLIDSATGKRVDGGRDWEELETVSGEEKYEAQMRRANEIAATWAQAEEAERQGDFAALRDQLLKYLALTSVKRDAVDAGEARQWRRNAAYDRLDALTALNQGASKSAVQAYLAARREYDGLIFVDAERKHPDPEHKFGGHSETITARKAIDAIPADRGLRDNIAYLRAAVMYADKQDDAAIQTFTQLADRYPQSEKREAALFMVGVINLQRSRAYTGESGDDGKHATRGDAIEEERANRCDDACKAAQQTFARVMREYPRGRYFSDARGWAAYLLLRKGERVQAMAEYYRMLAGVDLNAQVEATISLSLVRGHTNNEEMKQLEELLANEPHAALVYAYHSLFNYAVNPVCDSCWNSNDRYEEDNRYEEIERREREAGRDEVRRIAEFASRMLARYPHTPVGGGFALKLAQAHLETGNNRDALVMARRALDLGVSGEDREQALLARAFAEQRTRDFAVARKTLKTLLAEFPHGKLTEDAGRLLAMVCEDAGDLDAALEQYIAMDYVMDVDYFIDVLFTPEQLAAFISRHQNSDLRDKLYYTLGLRYLRESRWAEARAALAEVRTVKCQAEGYHTYSGEGQEKENPKLLNNEGMGVCRSWVLRDLKMIDELEWRSRAINEATSDEAKAEAMYQFASFQYQSSIYAFYNSAAWDYGRRGALLYGIGNLRLPSEQEMMRKHMEQVTPTARALAIYLEIARLFPQTKAARDALYTAAVCHERLADYNSYWRDAYHFGLHAGDRMVTYRDVKATYPKYQLPRGTTGWQPMTRTVNDGPGWDAPPKPRPKLSLFQRVTRRLETGAHRFEESMTKAGQAAWEGYVKPGLWALFAVAMTVCLWYAVIITAHCIRQRNGRQSAVMSIVAAEKLDAEMSNTESRVDRLIESGD